MLLLLLLLLLVKTCPFLFSAHPSSSSSSPPLLFLLRCTLQSLRQYAGRPIQELGPLIKDGDLMFKSTASKDKMKLRYALAHSPHSLTHSHTLLHSFTPSLLHSFTPSLTHLTHLTHTLTSLTPLLNPQHHPPCFAVSGVQLRVSVCQRGDCVQDARLPVYTQGLDRL